MAPSDADATSLARLTCNHLALGQWELAGAAARVLATRPGGAPRAAEILSAAATPPAHWLPLPGQASGTHKLAWWSVAQALGEPRTAPLSAGRRSRAELEVSAADLQQAVVADAVCESKTAQEILDRSAATLRELLRTDDGGTVEKVVDFCRQLQTAGAVLLPLEAAKGWAGGAGCCTAAGAPWGALHGYWQLLSEEQMVREQLPLPEMMTHLANILPRALQWELAEVVWAGDADTSTSDGILASTAVHASVIQSLLGCTSLQPLRYYCRAVEKLRLAPPAPPAPSVVSGSPVAHGSKPAQSLDSSTDVLVFGSGDVATSRWTEHILTCRRHELHLLEDCLARGLACIVGRNAAGLRELLCRYQPEMMKGVASALLTILAWASLRTWGGAEQQIYAALQSNEDVQFDTAGSQCCARYANVLRHHIKIALWYRERVACNEDRTAVILGQLTSGDLLVIEMVGHVLKTQDWRLALQMLGKGGYMQERSAELHLLTLYCCKRLVRSPPIAQQDRLWLLEQLNRLDGIVLSAACSISWHLLRSATELKDWRLNGTSARATYADWLLQGVLQVAIRFITSATATPSLQNCKTIITLQNAISEANIRIRASRSVCQADGLLFVQHFISQPQQFLYRCIHLGDWPRAALKLPLDDESLHEGHCAECHARFTNVSRPIDIEWMGTQFEATICSPTGALDTSKGVASACSLAKFSADVSFSLLVLDLAVCTDSSCVSSANMLCDCMAWNIKHKILIAGLQQLADALQAIARKLSVSMRFCRTFSQALACYYSVALDSSEVLSVDSVMSDRDKFTRAQQDLHAALKAASATALEEAHREWCLDTADRLSVLLQKGPWILSLYPALPRAAAQPRATKYARLFVEHLCNIQRCLSQSLPEPVSLMSIISDSLETPFDMLKQQIMQSHGKEEPAKILATELGFSAAGVAVDGVSTPMAAVRILQSLDVPAATSVLLASHAMQTVSKHADFLDFAITLTAAVPPLQRWLSHRTTLRLPGLESVMDVRKDSTSARQIISTLESRGDINATVSAADLLLASGAPDRLLLSKAQCFDEPGSNATPKLRCEMVERIRDAEAASDLCLRWVSHWSETTAQRLLLSCECKLQHSRNVGAMCVKLSEVRLCRSDLLVYARILRATSGLWPTWQSLHQQCTVELDDVIKLLTQNLLYDEARELIAQLESRKLSTALLQTGQSQSQKRLFCLRELVDKAELHQLLSGPNLLHRAFLLLSKQEPIDALRICADYVSSGLIDTTNTASARIRDGAEIQLVRMMLVFARKTSAAALVRAQLPSVGLLAARELGLKALALLPPYLADRARSLVSKPSLVIESLLRCREFQCARTILEGIPELIDDEMISTYACLAASESAKCDIDASRCLETYVIQSYFEPDHGEHKSNAGTPRSTKLIPDAHGPAWLSGDPDCDKGLRASFTMEGSGSTHMAQQVLVLCGSADRIGRATRTVCSTLIKSAQICEDIGAATRLLAAARHLCDFCRCHFEEARSLAGVEAANKLRRDVVVLSVLSDAGLDLSCAAEKIGSAQKCQGLVRSLVEEDRLALALRVAVLYGLDDEAIRWTWGVAAASQGQYNSARKILDPLLVAAPSARDMRRVIDSLETEPPCFWNDDCARDVLKNSASTLPQSPWQFDEECLSLLGSGDTSTQNKTAGMQHAPMTISCVSTWSARRLQEAFRYATPPQGHTRAVISLLLDTQQVSAAMLFAFRHKIPVPDFLFICEWARDHLSLQELRSTISQSALALTMAQSDRDVADADVAFNGGELPHCVRGYLLAVGDALADHTQHDQAYELALLCGEHGRAAMTCIAAFLALPREDRGGSSSGGGSRGGAGIPLLERAQSHLATVEADHARYVERAAEAVSSSASAPGQRPDDFESTSGGALSLRSVRGRQNYSTHGAVYIWMCGWLLVHRVCVRVRACVRVNRGRGRRCSTGSAVFSCSSHSAKANWLKRTLSWVWTRGAPRCWRASWQPVWRAGGWLAASFWNTGRCTRRGSQQSRSSAGRCASWR
jgi:hypothetical protein